MTDIELLPLPPLWICPNVEPADFPEVAKALIDYARANVAHATAPLQAEIEALRVDVEAWKASHSTLTDTCHHFQARAKLLADAINAYKSECDNPAKDYVLRAKRRDEMFALLHDHDQEVGE